MTVAPASRGLLGGRPRPPCLNDYKLRGFIMKTLLALILCLALSSFAATSKSVSYKSGDETVQAMLYAPDGKGPFPGIIVIHEYWGLNDWVKEQASKLADQGYVALAIDLYRGKSLPHRMKRTRLCAAFPKTAPNVICTLRSSFSNRKPT